MVIIYYFLVSLILITSINTTYWVNADDHIIFDDYFHTSQVIVDQDDIQFLDTNSGINTVSLISILSHTSEMLSTDNQQDLPGDIFQMKLLSPDQKTKLARMEISMQSLVNGTNIIPWLDFSPFLDPNSGFIDSTHGLTGSACVLSKNTHPSTPNYVQVISLGYICILQFKFSRIPSIHDKYTLKYKFTTDPGFPTNEKSKNELNLPMDFEPFYLDMYTHYLMNDWKIDITQLKPAILSTKYHMKSELLVNFKVVKNTQAFSEKIYISEVEISTVESIFSIMNCKQNQNTWDNTLNANNTSSQNKILIRQLEYSSTNLNTNTLTCTLTSSTSILNLANQNYVQNSITNNENSNTVKNNNFFNYDLNKVNFNLFISGKHEFETTLLIPYAYVSHHSSNSTTIVTNVVQGKSKKEKFYISIPNTPISILSTYIKLEGDCEKGSLYTIRDYQHIEFSILGYDGSAPNSSENCIGCKNSTCTLSLETVPFPTQYTINYGADYHNPSPHSLFYIHSSQNFNHLTQYTVKKTNSFQFLGEHLNPLYKYCFNMPSENLNLTTTQEYSISTHNESIHSHCLSNSPVVTFNSLQHKGIISVPFKKHNLTDYIAPSSVVFIPLLYNKDNKNQDKTNHLPIVVKNINIEPYFYFPVVNETNSSNNTNPRTNNYYSNNSGLSTGSDENQIEFLDLDYESHSAKIRVNVANFANNTYISYYDNHSIFIIKRCVGTFSNSLQNNPQNKQIIPVLKASYEDKSVVSIGPLSQNQSDYKTVTVVCDLQVNPRQISNSRIDVFLLSGNINNKKFEVNNSEDNESNNYSNTSDDNDDQNGKNTDTIISEKIPLIIPGNPKNNFVQLGYISILNWTISADPIEKQIEEAKQLVGTASRTNTTEIYLINLTANKMDKEKGNNTSQFSRDYTRFTHSTSSDDGTVETFINNEFSNNQGQNDKDKEGTSVSGVNKDFVGAQVSAEIYGGFTGKYILKDVQEALALVVKETDSKLENLKSTVINSKIFSQCLNHTCGDICAPCVGNEPCKSDFDCFSGICSVKSHKCVYEEIPDDPDGEKPSNNTFHPNFLYSIFVSGLLIVCTVLFINIYH